MRVLFVTSRNAYSTSGELRLIKNRFLTLMNQYDSTIDVVNFRHQRILCDKQEALGVNSYIIITHHWIDYCQKDKCVKKTVLDLLEKYQYDAVILSGMNVLPYVDKIKKVSPQVVMVADIHGAYEELVEFPRKDFFLNLERKAFYKIAKHIERKYLKQFDAYFVVSDALKAYLENEYHIMGKPFFRIPCAISDTIINIEECKANRKKYRAKYHLKDDELLFVYSGGVSPWQCIDESVEMYHDIERKLKTKCKLLLMSNNKQYLEKFSAEDVIIDSYSGDEVRKVLCAGDYAFMLRQNFVTNNVAYPNKFLEYVSCGLKIIATPHVHDVAKQIREFNIGICDNVNLNAEYFESSLAWMSDVASRNKLLQQTSFKTTLEPFAEYVNRKR